MLAALSEMKKQLVVKTAQTQVQTQVTSGVLPGTVEVYVPRVDPNWDYNDEGDYRLLKRYQEWIRVALENAIPKSVNWSRLYTIKRGQAETLSEFLDRLGTAMQKFTTIDPSSEGGKLQLVSLFLEQSAEDIRRKLQKMKEPDVRDLERLVEEAYLGIEKGMRDKGWVRLLPRQLLRLYRSKKSLFGVKEEGMEEGEGQQGLP
ncbi:uncharacterized protein LOC121061723 [Cygnus olor]|uniref:uncharacterized protein LOC121061723 n=1 Tax=Cygnus olor TaxID=8869 RepID=UPI001ADEB799|nr:uncharacterized protein LOC121061723 [Cygnus olor]